MFFYDLNFCVDFIYDLFIYVGFLDWFKVSASKMKEFHQWLLVFESFGRRSGGNHLKKNINEIYQKIEFIE